VTSSDALEKASKVKVKAGEYCFLGTVSSGYSIKYLIKLSPGKCTFLINYHAIINAILHHKNSSVYNLKKKLKKILSDTARTLFQSNTINL
jgi:hypothetical protein